jgi:Na+/melibiose symporter-like transporter
MARKRAPVSSHDDGRLSSSTLLAFSLPCLIQSLLFIPVMAVFPTIYEKYYGVSFAALGLAVLVSRSADSVVDPIVAYLSDRTRTPIGPRKPWLIGGGILGVVAIYYLFLPPARPDAIYFLVWSSAVYLAWSLMQVPHDAWATEISSDYDERSRIFTFKNTIGQIGGFAFFVLPIVLTQFFGFKSTEMTPQVMRVAGVASLVLLPLTLAGAVLLVPKAKVMSFQEINFVETIVAIARNRPYRIFLLVFAIQGWALGIYAAMIYPYLEGYMNIGAKPQSHSIWAASPLLVLGVANLFAIVSMPFWLWAAKTFGKHQAWGWGSFLTNIVLLGWLFVKPGQAAIIPTYVISALYGFFSSCASVCYPAIVADINDYGLLKSGASRAGTLFAGVTLVAKLTSAAGGAVALIMVGLFGFTTKPGAVLSDFTRFGVQFSFIGIHTVLQVIAVFFILKFPLNKRRHAAIRKRLDQKAARLAAAAAAAPAPVLTEPVAEPG